jgi:hypothetical protein
MNWDTEKIGNAVILAFFLILTTAAFSYAIYAY